MTKNPNSGPINEFRRGGVFGQPLQNERSALLLLTVLACLIVCGGSSKKTIAQSSSSEVASDADYRLHQECLETARKILGEHAEIVKYGAFNDPSVQEAVAVVRKEHGQVKGKVGLAVSKLVILRHEAKGWKVALTVSKQIQNGAGFVGIDYIDDSAPYYGYQVLFSEQRADGKRAFMLSLSYLANNGNTEGIPLEISWDNAVGRYREFGINSDPFGFKPEIKNPPHRKY
ncbi:MAG: hypothetical protein WA555_10570 [Candidatus Sulfotelmatobacter sp.]